MAMSSSDLRYSFVIPCYGSESTVVHVVGEIVDVMRKEQLDDYEIITVVDGSPDNVWNILQGLLKEYSKLRIIELSKNFGQANALMAGYDFARGNVVITLDDDGQCPVDHVNELLEPILCGMDMSVARYPQKKQSWFKNIGSAMNGMMARWLLGLPKDFQMSNFYAFNRVVLDRVRQYKNPYPYITGLASQATNRICNVPMQERDRISGSTNYSFRKLVALWLNGFTSFSVKPLRIADLAGTLCALIGFIYGIFVIIQKMANPNMAAGYPSLAALLLFIGGIIMVLLGLTGEYIGRIFICINQPPQYVIRDMRGFADDGFE